MNLKDILKKTSKKDRDDALWLLSSLLQKNRGELLLDSSLTLKNKEVKLWKEYWKKRNRGLPLQYIVGKAPFFGEEYFINSNVLIPRPETEILVEECLNKFKDRKELRLLDIGTGSGIIGITLKIHQPSWFISMSDISSKALNVARKNALDKKCDLSFIKMNGLDLEKFQEPLDAVISNPPYLNKQKDTVAKQVLKYEPSLALFPLKKPKNSWTNDQGIWIADQIIKNSLEKRVKYILMELSPRVAYKLEQHWKRNINVKRIERFSDLTGRKRFLDIELTYG